MSCDLAAFAVNPVQQKLQPKRDANPNAPAAPGDDPAITRNRIHQIHDREVPFPSSGQTVAGTARGITPRRVGGKAQPHPDRLMSQ